MRTIDIKLYKFNELTEEAQRKAIDNLCDINVDHDWWECVYQDAEDVGLLIKGFDINRRTIEIDFYQDAEHSACHILSSHGHESSTYQNTIDFVVTYLQYRDNDEKEEVRYELLRDLGNSYLAMLENEYEYLTSEEAIVETIVANEYEFTENGKFY